MKSYSPDFQGLRSFDLDLFKDDSIVEFHRRAARAAGDALRPWRTQAMLNLAWFEGDQFVDYDDETGGLYVDPRFTMRTNRNLTIFWMNLLRRYVLHMMARFMRSKFTWRSDPRNPSQLSDIVEGRKADKWLPYQWERFERADEQGFQFGWCNLIVMGCVYADMQWMTNRAISVEAMTETELNVELKKFAQARIAEHERGTPEWVAMSGWEHEQWYEAWVREELGTSTDRVQRLEGGGVEVEGGDLRLKWRSGLRVIEDVAADDWDEKRWCRVREKLPVELVRERFGKKADNVTGDRGAMSANDDDDIETRLRGGDRTDPETDAACETTYLDTIYWRASKRYPKGRMAVICENLVMDKGDNPSPDRDLGLIPIYEQPAGYDLRPTSQFTDLLVQQNAINKLLVSGQLHIAKTSEPTILAEAGTLDEETAFVTEPNVVFYARGSQPPTPIQLGSMAAHYPLMVQLLINEFKEQAGLTSVSVGDADANAQTASGTRALIERSDMQLVVLTDSIRRGLERLGERAIKLMAAKMPNETTVMIVGRDGQRTRLSMNPAKWIREGEGKDAPSVLFDIRVSVDRKPDREEVLNTVSFLLESRLKDPMGDQEALMAAIMNGDVEALDQTADDREKAIGENEVFLMASDALNANEQTPDQILQKVQALVKLSLSDDHDVHASRHSVVLNRYGTMIHPEAYKLFEAHYAAHQQQALLRIQQQASVTPSAIGGGSAFRRNGKNGVTSNVGR